MVVTALSNVERAERWYQQGQQSLSYSMIDEAIAQFEQALHLAPSHKSARTMLAATLYGQQRSDEANSVLVDGLRRQPSVLEWRVLIAKMATEQKQYSRVLAALGDEYDEHALRLAQNDYWILKGSAARNLKRFDIAKTSFTVLIKRQPNVAKWWLALATSEDGLGELQAAKSHYGTALQLGGLSMQSQRFARARYEQL
ncbi:tetratricopeptide repeat protein [Pseudoalteromonas sp. GB56]